MIHHVRSHDFIGGCFYLRKSVKQIHITGSMHSINYPITIQRPNTKRSTLFKSNFRISNLTVIMRSSYKTILGKTHLNRINIQISSRQFGTDGYRKILHHPPPMDNWLPMACTFFKIRNLGSAYCINRLVDNADYRICGNCIRRRSENRTMWHRRMPDMCLTIFSHCHFLRDRKLWFFSSRFTRESIERHMRTVSYCCHNKCVMRSLEHFPRMHYII